MTRVALLVHSTCALLLASSAIAQHESIEALYADASFAEVLERTEERILSGGLSESELVAILELRALSAFALTDEETMERALGWLAALSAAPERLRNGAPPPVTAAYARARDAPLTLEVTLVREGARLVLARTVRNAPRGFVEEVVFQVQVDDGPWRRSEASALPDSGVHVRFYGWIVGPGGVRTQVMGSEGEPRELALTRAPWRGTSREVFVSDASLWQADPTEDFQVVRRRRRRILLSVAVLAVAAAVALGVGLSLRPSDPDSILVVR